MGLIEDTKRLAESEPLNDEYGCYFCGAWVAKHADECAWLAMPRIVAALDKIKGLAIEGEEAAYEGDVKFMSRLPGYILEALK